MRPNADLTIYNRYVAAGAEVWQRSQVRDVHWENGKGRKVELAGTIAADQAEIYIPTARPGYVAPKAWGALANKAGKWTLKPGDVVVKGLVSDSITSPSALKAKYDDVLEITSVDSMDYGSAAMQHWQLGVK